MFLSPRCSEAKYARFYDSEYDQQYRPEAFTAEQQMGKYKNIKQIWSRLEGFDALAHARSVLDVGSGTGWALEWLRQHCSQFDTFAAIESSAHCVEYLQNVVGATVIARNIYDSWESDDVDLVIMRHVLEHLRDPIDALDRVSRSLSSAGLVYVAVPDMMKPRSPLRGYWFRPVHLFYFSESTLLEVAAKAGLSPLIIKSEHSELWAVFEKSMNPSRGNLSAVYSNQIEVIRRQKCADILFSFKRVLGRMWHFLSSVRRAATP